MNKIMEKIYYASPTPFKTFGVNLYEFWTSWRYFKSRKYQEWSKILHSSEKWSIKELENWQNKYFNFIIRYAYNNVAFYRELYDSHGIKIDSIKSKEDIEKLPIIEKEQIRDNPRIFSKKREKYIIRHTSGTTGKPLTIRVSKDAYLLDLAVAYHGRRYRWAGYDGGYIARLVGDKPVRKCNDKRLHIVSHVTRRVIFPSYCLTHENIKRILDVIKKMNIQYLQAYPSTAYLLAKFLEIEDEILPLKAIFLSSEPVYEFQRQIIMERFNAPIFGFYGQAETLVSAVECKEGNYHLTMLDGILEVVDVDGNSLEVGEKGFVVATSLHNIAMPLIRYKLGDYSGYLDKGCECGIKLPLIFPIEAKEHDFIITPENKIISPSLLTFPFKYSRGIIEAQVIQKDLNKIVLRIVRDQKRYTSKDEQNLLASIRELVGPNVEIELEYVTQIYPTAAFKKRFVISQLPRELLEKVLSGEKL